MGRRKLVKLTLLNTALVLGRDSSGRAFALRDACPHKGMPLSDGWHQGDTVQCSFHGWKFNVQTGAASLCRSAQRRSRPRWARFEPVMCRVKSAMASSGCTSPSPPAPAAGRGVLVAATAPVASGVFREIPTLQPVL